MKPKNDPYAFISYASANREEALKIFSILTNKHNRLTCWLDVEDISISKEDFQKQIYEGIKNASCVILIETEEARQSPYVALERSTAQEFGVPVFRYTVIPGQSKIIQALWHFLLAQRVRFRVTQPFWVSLLVLAVVLAAMGVVSYFFGALALPASAKAAARLLPEAVYESASQSEVSKIPAEQQAPFHYLPNYALLLDDFSDTGSLNEDTYSYDIKPRSEEVNLTIEDGSLSLFIPQSCYSPNDIWPCEIEIHSKQLELTPIHYFGFRARINGISNAENISLSVSIPSWSRRRSGFGWNLSEHATPFFRCSTKLPEEEFFAYVDLKEGWHAYEILLNPENAELTYYLDGQLIDAHQMKYYEEWKTAPLTLIIRALADGIQQPEFINPVDTEIEIDQIIVGGFNNAAAK